jgi:hypothetical protein
VTPSGEADHQRDREAAGILGRTLNW